MRGLDGLGPLVFGVLSRDLADLEHEVVLVAVLVMNHHLVLDLEAGLVDHALDSVVLLCPQDVRLDVVRGEAHVAVLMVNVDQVLDLGADVDAYVLGNLMILSPCDTGLGGVRDEAPS